MPDTDQSTRAGGAAPMQEGVATAPKLTLRCQFCAKPMLLDRPFKLDDESFERTIRESEVPVVVDFYADWCGPCKAMAPAVDQLAAAFQGRALVAKLDTDHAQRTAAGFQIRGIPTV